MNSRDTDSASDSESTTSKSYIEAVQKAFRDGTIDEIQLFTEPSPDKVELRNRYSGESLLYFAAHNSLAVRRFIATDPNVLNQLGNGTTAIHAAALAGLLSEVREIISERPEAISETDDLGHNALFYAACGGQPLVVTWLLSQTYYLNNPQAGKLNEMLRGAARHCIVTAAKYDVVIEFSDIVIEQYQTVVASINHIYPKTEEDRLLIASINKCIARVHHRENNKDEFREALDKASLLANALAASNPQNPIIKSNLLHLFTEIMELSAKNFDDNKAANSAQASDLQTEAAKWGFITQNVIGDGDCLFHAVLDQVNHRQLALTGADSIQDMRNKTADHIDRHRGLYQDFLFDTPIDEFINRTRKKRSWADELTVAAFSRTYNVNVVVISNTGAPPVIHRRKNPTATFYLGHEVVDGEETHYQSLRPTGSKSIADAINNATIDDFVETPKRERDDEQAATSAAKIRRTGSGTLFSPPSSPNRADNSGQRPPTPQ